MHVRKALYGAVLCLCLTPMLVAQVVVDVLNSALGHQAVLK